METILSKINSLTQPIVNFRPIVKIIDDLQAYENKDKVEYYYQHLVLDRIEENQMNNILLSQPINIEERGDIFLLDRLLNLHLQMNEEKLTTISLGLITNLIQQGSFSNQTLPTIFKHLAKDYQAQKVDIFKVKEAIKILQEIFSPKIIQRDWPTSLFVLPNKGSCILAQHQAITWPFNKGMTQVSWVYLIQNKKENQRDQESSLFNLQVGNMISSQFLIKNNTIQYSSQIQGVNEKVDIGLVPFNKWIQIRWNLKPAANLRYSLQVSLNDQPLNEVKVNFPNLQGKYKFSIKFGEGLQGYISTIMLFNESISFDFSQLRNGVITEPHMRNLYKILEQNFQSLHLMYTPLRTGGMCYDVVGKNHGEFIGDTRVYQNYSLQRKWKIMMTIQSILPFFHYLKHISYDEYPLYLNEILSLLVTIFTSRTDAQSEAKSIYLFPLISQFILEGDSQFFTSETVHILASLYKCLIDRQVKDKMFVELLWSIPTINFTSMELFEDFFQLIRVIYNSNPIQCSQLFSVSDILNQLIEICQFDRQFTLVEEKQIQILRIYSNLIENICLVVKSNDQAQKQSKQFNKSTILQLLNFLSVKYHPQFTISILQLLQFMIYVNDNQDCRQTLQQNDTFFSIIELCVNTQSPQVKTMAVNLIHKIVKGNSSSLDEHEVYIILSSMFRRPQITVGTGNSILQKRDSKRLTIVKNQYQQQFKTGQIGQKDQYMSYSPLYVALMNWTLHIHGRLQIQEAVIIDDSVEIKSKNALLLVLRFFKFTDGNLKVKILQDLYTLIKFNQSNKQILLEEESFHRYIIEVLLDLQVKQLSTPLQEYEEWLWDSGMKLYLQLIWYSISTQNQGFKKVTQMITQLNLLEEEKQTHFVGLASKYLLRTLIRNLLIIIKEQSASNQLLKHQPWICENIQTLYGLILCTFLCDPLQSTYKNQQVVLQKYFRTSFKLFVVNNKDPIPINWKSTQIYDDKWIDYKLFPQIYQLTASLCEKYSLEVNNNNWGEEHLIYIAHLFDTSQINEIKELFNKLLWNFGFTDFKSSNVFFLRIVKQIFNFYADYILFNDKIGQKEQDLIYILNYENNITCLLVLIYEILKSKQQFHGEEFEMKVYNFALEHLSFLYSLKKQAVHMEINELFEDSKIGGQNELDISDKEVTLLVNEIKNNFEQTKSCYTRLINEAITNFISYIVKITNHILKSNGKEDLLTNLKQKKYLTFRILAKILKQDKKEVTIQMAGQEFYDSLSTPSGIEALALDAKLQSFFLESPVLTKKFDKYKLKYDDLEIFNNIEIKELKKKLQKQYQASLSYEDLAKKRYLDQIMLTSGFSNKNFDFNMFYVKLFSFINKKREQDQQISTRQAKHQHRRSWNFLFSEIGLWNTDQEISSKQPPKSYTFKISKYLTKSRLRPMLKIKKTYTEFDGLPLLIEAPYESFADQLQKDVMYDDIEVELTSPSKRKKLQLQWDETPKQVDVDWKDNVYNFIKDFAQTQNNNPSQVYKVQWIKTLSIRVGTFEIAENKIKFTQDLNSQVTIFIKHKSPQSRLLIKEWLLTDIAFLMKKRYLSKKRCLELFLKDGQILLFNFKDSIDQILQIIATQIFNEKSHKQLMIQTYLQNENNSDIIFEKQRKTLKWLNGKTSTISYLLYLNELASRSYKDLTQYPVLPWVIKKYNTDKLDLKAKDAYRDLTKPMGACGSPERSLAFHQKFYNSDLHQEGIPPFHYGSHYSNPGIIMHFLLRVQPFSRGARELQSGRWDIPDRLFYSVKELYLNATNEMSDVRELVPEMFCLPEMILNLEGYNFGPMQTGEFVDNVVLPKWVGQTGPFGFIATQRQAMESEQVTSQINNWIDLIFGVKQRGKAAEENLNQFYFLTYEDAVQIDTIEDLPLKKSLESQLIHFGQTPSQILSKPHPQKTNKIIATILDKGLKPLIFQYKKSEDNGVFRSVMSVFKGDYLQQTQPKEIQKILFLSFITDSKLLIVRKNGEISIIRFLDPQKPNTFEFFSEKELNINLEMNEGTHMIYKMFIKDERVLKFSPEQSIQNQMKIIYLNRYNLFLIGGIWDGRLEVFHLENENKKMICYHNHLQQISAMATDSKQQFVLTGCLQGQVTLYKIQPGTFALKQQASYFDHLSEVNDITVSNDLRVFVTCGTDGRINFYNIQNTKYLRSFFHNKPVNQIKIIHCPLYSFVFFSKLENKIYSVNINGQLIETFQLDYLVISPLHTTILQNFDEILFFVNQYKRVVFLSTPFLTEYATLAIDDIQQTEFAPIALRQDQKVLFIGFKDGNLVTIADPSFKKNNNN